MSVLHRITVANIAVTAWNLLIMILIPLGIGRLPEAAFLAILIGGATAVWGAAFAVASLVRGDAEDTLT